MSAKKTVKKKTVKTTTGGRPLTNLAQDRKWGREDDARTLARAEEIKADQKRLRDAKREAVLIVKERERELTSIKKIAKKKI